MTESTTALKPLILETSIAILPLSVHHHFVRNAGEEKTILKHSGKLNTSWKSHITLPLQINWLQLLFVSQGAKECTNEMQNFLITFRWDIVQLIMIKSGKIHGVNNPKHIQTITLWRRESHSGLALKSIQSKWEKQTAKEWTTSP